MSTVDRDRRCQIGGKRRGLARFAIILLALTATSLAAAATGPRRASARGALAQAEAQDRWNLSAERSGSEVPVAWFSLMTRLIRDEKLPPTAASRRIGYAGVALYEAIVPGAEAHRSLGGQLNGLGTLPSAGRGRHYHWPAVANAALARALKTFFSAASAASLAAIDELEQRFAASYQESLPGPVLEGSIAYGRSVADAVASWAAADGFSTYNNCAYTAPIGPGLWEPTPPIFAAHQPCWGQLRPFVLSSGGECAPPPPPAFSTDAASPFFAEAMEVYTTTTTLTPEQNAIAIFWADNPAQTATPPGHWISILNQIAVQKRLSLATSADGYARVGIAMADSFIACWNVKYVYNLLRPITYIQHSIDAAWTSPIPTPGFPEYTSGHSVQSAAAATVLADLLGIVAFTDSTHAGLGMAPRSFASFEQAAGEAAVSRLYGGIHYRSAIERGMAQGQCIGQAILDRVDFTRP